jgi:hypothetical protein
MKAWHGESSNGQLRLIIYTMVVIVSPLEIIFDPSNPARRFWSMESLRNEKGEVLPGSVWQYKIEIRNNSSKTLKKCLRDERTRRANAY